MSRIFSLLLCCLIVFTFSDYGFAFDDSDKESRGGEQDELVTEIGPGKRLYGKKPEFSEIGHANNFDLSPDGKKIAFMSHEGVRYWDIEKGKLEEVENESGEVKHSSPGQFFEYSADGLKLFSSAWSSVELAPSESDDDEEDEEDEESTPQRVVAQGQVIQVRSAVTGELITTIRPEVDEKNPHRHMSFMLAAPDGDYVLLGFGQRSEIYDTDTGELVHKLKHKSWVQSAVFDNDGKRLIDGNGKIIDIESGETEGKLPRMIFGQYLNSMRFHPKKNMIAASEWSKGVILYDLDDKERVELEIPSSVKQQHMYNLEFSGDGELLVSATYANYQTGKGKPTIVVWDVESGKVVDEIQYGGGHLARLRVSPDNKFVYAKSHAQFGISRYQIDGKRTNSEASPSITNPIQRFQFVDDDERVIACPQQGKAVVFEIESGKPTGSISNQNIAHLEMAESGKYAVMASNYRNVKIHNTETGKNKTIQVKSFSRPSVVSQLGNFLKRKKDQSSYENFAIGSVSISDDNKHFLVALRGRQSFLWQKFRIDNGENVEQKKFKFSDYWDVGSKEDNLNTVSQYHWMAGAASISPDGRYYAILGPERKVYVIEAETGDEAFDFEVSNFNHGSTMFFSRDSEKLIVKHGKKIKTYDLESGDEAGGLEIGSESYQYGLSRDRTKLALIKNNPMEVVVYDLDSEEELFSKKLKQGYTGVGISDDGERLALGRATCQFEIWDIDKVD